jgi:hypothetical protein
MSVWLRLRLFSPSFAYFPHLLRHGISTSGAEHCTASRISAPQHQAFGSIALHCGWVIPRFYTQRGPLSAPFVCG